MVTMTREAAERLTDEVLELVGHVLKAKREADALHKENAELKARLEKNVVVCEPDPEEQKLFDIIERLRLENITLKADLETLRRAAEALRIIQGGK